MEEFLTSCEILGEIITIENAREYYKEYNGDIHNLDGSGLKFYKQHFNKEQFLKWNEEIVVRKINEYKEKDKIIYNKAEEGWKHFYKLAWLVYMEYVEDKDIYKQRIELLKKLYKDYGYFMNYICIYSSLTYIVHEHRVFINYLDYPIHVKSDYYHNEYEDPTNSGYFDSSRTRTGLIPDLYHLGYYDLLDKYLEECFLPICLHYREKSGTYFKLYKMHYKTFGEHIDSASNITNIIKFLREKNYKLPKELDEFWKEREI